MNTLRVFEVNHQYPGLDVLEVNQKMGPNENTQK